MLTDAAKQQLARIKLLSLLGRGQLESIADPHHRPWNMDLGTLRAHLASTNHWDAAEVRRHIDALWTRAA